MYWRGKRADTGFEFRGDARVGSATMVPVQQRPRYWWWLYQVLRGMCWTKVWTACLETELILYIDTYVIAQMSARVLS